MLKRYSENAGICVAVWVVMGVIRVAAASQTVTPTAGAVNGVVTDTSKAVVPGVTVSLSGSALLDIRSASTDAAGSYRFSAVPPGEYTFTFAYPGFTTVLRDGIRIGVGFTATVDAQLEPGGVTAGVSVSGTPLIDLASTNVVTHFDSGKLAALPGLRDIFSALNNTPGVALAKPDVGGSGVLSLQDYTAYGLRAVTGMNRNEVEGIRVGGANGINDNYYSDFASFAEVAISAVGNSAAMPVPGTMTQYVSKSGGNAYHGDVYAGVQNEAGEAFNIDARQIARGVAGGPALEARDVNRLEHLRDFNADIGGYVKTNAAWWYAAYRNTEVAQRYPWLLDSTVTLKAQVGTGKLTYNLSPRQKLVGYLQYQTFSQLNNFQPGVNLPVQNGDALSALTFPISVWKGDYSAALTDAIYLEARVGGYRSNAVQTFKSTGPRIADIGANTMRGATFAGERLTKRPQVNGALSFSKSGWLGSHTFRIGGEYMLDEVAAPHFGYGNPCNCISTLINGVPSQVQIFSGTNLSRQAMVTAAGFIDDTWRPTRRVTLSLGIRLDRYQPGLPAQQGPAGQSFPAIDPVLTFDNWGPRAGVSVDVTGRGKTVVKLHYGTFWLYPGSNFTAAFNPNPSGWSRTYRWSADANANGRWDTGEEGALLSVAGGSASTRLDPGIENTYVHQATTYLEHEVANGFAMRTGFVINSRRQPYGTVNSSRPLSAFSVPRSTADPGVDGLLGTADDGAAMMTFDLAAESLGTPPLNVTSNLPDSASDYYTWEVTATKRQSGRWSLLASFTETWNREAALGTGTEFTPNALINATGKQNHFTTWQAKVHGTVRLPYEFQIAPMLRSQSGTPFARSFVATLNYGTATIKAEPLAANRTDTVTLIDLRAERTFQVRRSRITGFLDVYNLLNTNAEQAVTTTSGSSWLRPTTITAPRIARIGARLKW